MWPNASDIDRWFERASGRPPGKIVLFIGAGVSVDAPANLPPAIPLTEALVRHLLCEGTAEEILRIFREHSHILGRSVPRLEHLLSAAIASSHTAERLLEIFDDVRPNRNHGILARYLLETRGWAITTNLDEGLEKAAEHRIPVHVFDPDQGSMRILGAQKDSNWGLIKLHGTIALGTRNLGATLQQLTPGLPGPVRELMHRVFAAADIVLVAGYSGSDHFDVNAFLQTKLNTPYLARLLWIEHQVQSGTLPKTPPRCTETKGFEVFQYAFRSGYKVHTGSTVHLLAGLLGDAITVTDEETENSWRERLNNLYSPTIVDRHRTALNLAVSMGLTTLAQESVDQLRHASGDSYAGLLPEADSYGAEGRWRIALRILLGYEARSGANTNLQKASVLRRAGKPLCALLHLTATGVLSDSDRMERRLLASECLIDLCRAAQRRGVWRSSTARRLWDRIIGAQLGVVGRWLVDCIDPVMELRTQRIAVSSLMSCTCAKDFDEIGPDLLGLIEEEMRPPELFVKGNAAMPGFYVMAATTAAELDRLDDLLEVRLAYADSLACYVERRFCNVIPRVRVFAPLLRRFRAPAHDRSCYSYFWEVLFPLQKLARLTKEQLAQAADIAEMLDNDYARTRVAKAWIYANRVFGGLSNWKQQRLYLP